MSDEKAENSKKWLRWAKRLGFWGFMFFLVKGLIWLFFLSQLKECINK
ncbi:MAG: hypothetical protein RLZZ546_380 [Bacteroidota bacterium]|jgi:hypothetical protein